MIKCFHTVSVLYRPNFRLQPTTVLNFSSSYVVTRYYITTTTEIKLLCASLIQFFGTAAPFVLQSFPHQHQCRCGLYFRFSVFRIPFCCVSAFSTIHPQFQRNTHNASSILFSTCSYSGKVVPTAGRWFQENQQTSSLLAFFLVRKWCLILLQLSMTTKSECGECRRCRGFHTHNEWWGQTVLRTGSFFYSLLNDHAMAIEFLKDIGFIQRTMQCNSCGRDMTWSEHPDVHDGVYWRCQWRVAGARCMFYFHCHVPLITHSHVIIFGLKF